MAPARAIGPGRCGPGRCGGDDDNGGWRRGRKAAAAGGQGSCRSFTAACHGDPARP